MNPSSPVATGNTADIYLHDGNIVKVYTRAIAETAELEAANQAYAGSLGLPVPKVIEVKDIDGRPALVMEHVRGETMKDLLLQYPARVQDFLARSVDIQLQVHSTPAPGLRQMSDRLREQIGSVDQLTGAKKLELIAMLEDSGDETHLCHGDFHVQNLIVNNDDVAIIDWMDATSGDVRLDACRSYMIYAEVDRDFANAYLAEYCRQSGLERNEVLHWLPVIEGARLSEWVSK